MRVSMKPSAGLLLLSSLFSGHAQALEPDVLFNKVSPSVWTVRTLDAQERPLRSGSAVVVAPGRLITNCHVLAKASSVVIRRDNVTYGATLEYPDVERDLCQLRVANFNAAPVVIAPATGARVGQRVYAIGSPRGLENTLSEGILSGLRGGDGSETRMLQTTAAISPGSSGGGLFDSEGRLLGITSAGIRDGGNLNFAVPAEFVAEIANRAQKALDARPPTPVAVESRAPASGPADVAVLSPTEPLRAGDGLEYVLTDQATMRKVPVVYRLDRIRGDELSFNSGGRIEKKDGQVVAIAAPLGGLFDTSSPPGGWGRKDLRPGMRWHMDFVAASGERWRHELDAAVIGGDRSLRVDGTDIKVVQIAYTGWIYVSYGSGSSAAGTRFEATVWYSNEMGRVLRFEGEHRRSGSTTKDSLELVRVLR